MHRGKHQRLSLHHACRPATGGLAHRRKWLASITWNFLKLPLKKIKIKNLNTVVQSNHKCYISDALQIWDFPIPNIRSQSVPPPSSLLALRIATDILFSVISTKKPNQTTVRNEYFFLPVIVTQIKWHLKKFINVNRFLFSLIYSSKNPSLKIQWCVAQREPEILKPITLFNATAINS